jgi:single-strand DNA-binding protein
VRWSNYRHQALDGHESGLRRDSSLFLTTGNNTKELDVANGVNKVIIIGNLGRDPEVRYTQSGNAVSNLRIAVGERKKEGDQWVDHTEWISVVCFGKTAENVGQYLEKGRQVYVEGRMQTRRYTDKQGVEKWSTEVVAREVLFLSGGGGGGGGGGGQRRGNSGGGGNRGGGNRGGNQNKQAANQDFYDDDLPF